MLWQAVGVKKMDLLSQLGIAWYRTSSLVCEIHALRGNLSGSGLAKN